MKKPIHLLQTLFAMSFLILCSCTSKTEKKEIDKKPNIVWIIVEDLSPDLGCYGNGLVKSPTIDLLANQGIKYTNAFAAGPACSPSRTALSVGHYQNSIGAHHMRYPDHLRPELPNAVIPIHTLMKQNGYQTANINTSPGNQKTDWLFKYSTKTYDFKKWDSIDTNKPFFARINLGLTHRGFVRDPKNPIDSDLIDVPPYYPNHKVARDDWRNYFESIQVLDGQIAKIITDLKTKGLTENTLIFFFSDHGRPMTRAKNFLYDSGLQVPLIVTSFDKKIKEKYLTQNNNAQLISLIDVNATSLALAEINYASQGKSFLNSGLKDERKYVYAAADRMGEIFYKSRTIRSKKLKYIRNYNHNFSVNSGSTAYRKANHPIYHLLNILDEQKKLNNHQAKLLKNLDYEELYDLETDPFELNNLVHHPKWKPQLSKMQIELDKWLVAIDDKGLLKDADEIVTAFDNYEKKSKKKYKKSIQNLENKVRSQIENK